MRVEVPSGRGSWAGRWALLLGKGKEECAVTTMFSASLWPTSSTICSIRAVFNPNNSLLFPKGRQQHASFRAPAFFPISYSPGVTFSQNISHPYTATNANLELGSYTEGEHPLAK